MTGRRLAALLILDLALLLLSGCNRSDAARLSQEADRPGVEVRVASRGELVRVVRGSASLSAARAATVVSQSTGEIEAILVEEGDRVHAGQVLARLDSQRLRLTLAKQRAVEQRLAHESERSRTLASRQLISAEAADRARFDHLAQLAASDLAALDLAHATIRAPFAGVITRRLVRPGQTLELNQAAFELADFESLEARLSVPESALADIAVGQAAEFEVDALPGQRFSSQVIRVPAVVDAATGTAPVTLAVDAAGTSLRPGLMVRVRITVERLEDVVRVPKSALTEWSDGLASVFVIDQGIARRQPVTLGASQDDWVQVLTGVEPGAEVAVLGLSQLRDQQAVSVIRSPDAAEASASLAAR